MQFRCREMNSALHRCWGFSGLEVLCPIGAQNLFQWFLKHSFQKILKRHAYWLRHDTHRKAWPSHKTFTVHSQSLPIWLKFISHRSHYQEQCCLVGIYHIHVSGELEEGFNRGLCPLQQVQGFGEPVVMLFLICCPIHHSFSIFTVLHLANPPASLTRTHLLNPHLPTNPTNTHSSQQYRPRLGARGTF